MLRFAWKQTLAGVAGLALTAAVAAYAADPPPAKPPADRGKRFIEAAPEGVVARSAPAKAADGFVNPKVEPGKVQWHATFAAACQASAKSGKPVMLFQMMGKLDDQFC